VPSAPAPAGISAHTLASKIDAFLASRGYKAPEAGGAGAVDDRRGRPSGRPELPPATPAPATPETPAEFVCEDDVRAAIRAGRKVLIGEKTIITPSARDLGEAQKVFVQAAWPR
jgi:acetaldehyde dehydrogenase (acetylating)